MVLRTGTALQRAAAGLFAAGSIVLLGGCGLFGGEDVPRNEAGTVTEPARTGGYAVQPGDCLTDPGEKEVREVTIVPCAEEHAYEAYAAKDLPAGDYPGARKVEAEAREFCSAGFEDFVGASYDDSELLIRHFHPTENSWKDRGGREILCLVADSVREASTGSLKGAER
jgi:hypothetical protein